MILPHVKIAIIGGTGKEGRGIAFRWGAAGFHVTIGSRDADKAEARAKMLNQILGNDCIKHAQNEQAIAKANIVILAVPYECAADALQRYAKHFQDKTILVDATVPLTGDDPMRYLESQEGSGSERLRSYLPDSIPLVAAFKTISAFALFDPANANFSNPCLVPPLDCDDFVASDSEPAKTIVIESMKLIKGLRPLDAGPLENSRSIERLTVLIIALNRLNGVKTGRYCVVGL
jgi:NADPH-dependent F420 reductase